jgi:D-alanyl-lipoteichoic acid acyltransferase DltB (MBOAT superfamily)
MVFNSFPFLVFFLVVTTLFFALPHRARWFLLLSASCAFYMWFIPSYILILGFTIIVDYFAGLWIAGSVGQRRKFALTLSLVANVGVLAFFKYFNFLTDNLAGLAAFLGWTYPVQHLAIVLPIGLSFHTFQAMSYTIEVYRGNQPPERHFGIYALYVMFYPQLVAGPIERPQNLLHQFHERQRFDYSRVASGLRLMAWGLFKKAVIADRTALLVNPVYASPGDYTGPALALATVFFAFQIFCDFSGYSDIAIGAARVMGFKLMRNFDRPYHAVTISEFWRRWHISLSTWFKDYLYIPLGGSRVAGIRWAANIMIVFLVSGLWHGANWTYVVWGGLHGVFLCVGGLTVAARARAVAAMGLNRLPALHGLIRNLCVFALVCLTWIYFRATGVGEAWTITTGLLNGWGDLANPAYWQQVMESTGFTKTDVLLAAGGLAVMETVHLMQDRMAVGAAIAAAPWYVRWPVYYAIVAAVFFLHVSDGGAFIYFQF